MTITAMGGLSLAVWLYLLLARGGFWRTRERAAAHPPDQGAWPDVIAIVPARNEAEVIARSLESLLAQDYPGRLDIVVVDDHSDDGTAERARATAQHAGRRLELIQARPLPSGWAGKVWALSQGLEAAKQLNAAARYIWLSDADIAHDKSNLRRLVATAETGGHDLVSQMVVLATGGFWPGLLIPAFVYFFQKLYPFAWVNDPRRRTAAAAGGCMLVRRDALERIDGFAAIHGARIDDCALARAIKDRGRGRGGRLQLTLTTAATSLRPYRGLREIWRMVARSAYIQLRQSVALLIATLAGMTLTYLVPPAILLSAPWHSDATATTLAGLAWGLMASSFVPILHYYRRPLLLAPLLPVAGLLYGAMTLGSAISHWRGRGGAWKGRTIAEGPPAPDCADPAAAPSEVRIPAHSGEK